MQGNSPLNTAQMIKVCIFASMHVDYMKRDMDAPRSRMTTSFSLGWKNARTDGDFHTYRMSVRWGSPVCMAHR